MRLSRRTFIVSGIGLAGLGVVGGGALTAVTSNELMVIDVVKRNLTFTGVSDDELLDFARAYLAEPGKTSRTKLTLLRLLTPFIDRGGNARKLMPRFLREDLASFERLVFTQFILATDLLDETRENKQQISYLGYYDPLSNPCANPLTKFYKT